MSTRRRLRGRGTLRARVCPGAYPCDPCRRRSGTVRCLPVGLRWRWPPMRYVFGECILDTQRAELCRAGEVRRLRRKAFQVLAYLLAHPDRVVAKQELCEQVWPQQFISDAALESTIKAVRQALGDSGREQRLIQTVYGQGYRLIAPVEERPESSSEDEVMALTLEPPAAPLLPDAAG